MGYPVSVFWMDWWVERHWEGVTGWVIGAEWQTETNSEQEAISLYDKLERVITPMFYPPASWGGVLARFYNISKSVIAPFLYLDTNVILDAMYICIKDGNPQSHSLRESNWNIGNA